MQTSPAPARSPSQLDLPRIFAVVLVMVAHVAGLLSLQLVMRPAAEAESPLGTGTNVTVEFLAPDPAPPDDSLAPRDIAPTRRSTKPLADSMPAPVDRSTSVWFAEDIPALAAPPPGARPHIDAPDVFDPPAQHKPFPRESRFSSNLPDSVIRLPDRPSVMKTYWAVPERENLQGRVARTVPVVGLLLIATGAIGAPHCPPKSEHPDCLQRLLDGEPP